MKDMKIPEGYIGREQALVKHTILKTYLERLFMIIGRSEKTINYVDCFAGPWEDEDEELRHTSIGISISLIESCVLSLNKRFNCTVKFRALYIEKDPNAYQRLKTYINNQSNPSIELKCMEGDYTKLLDNIIDWCDSSFTFFFIDPKGWKKVIGGETLKPLLKLKKAEFIINLMYEFANRFINLEQHKDDMVELLGEVPDLKGEDPEKRKNTILSLYRKNLNKYFCGRTTYVPIERPGKELVLYFLVYLTRHPIGIDVFKDESENMLMVQRIMHVETKLRKQLEKSPIDDMFGSDDNLSVPDDQITDNRYAAKEYLLKNLSETPTLIDYEKWADFLEDSDLYPNDFQLAMKELATEKLVENIDADVSRRTKKIIKPNWPKKSEKWVLCPNHK